jgi:hypothetical protein
MNKVFQIVAWITIILAIGLMFLVGFWLTYPYKPIVFNNLPLEIDTKVVKQGQPLVYVADYCKYDNIIPTTSITFVDQIVYMVPFGLAVAKPIGCAVTRFQIEIPFTLPPSEYVLKISYKYKVNPIRDATVSVESEPFQVTK